MDSLYVIVPGDISCHLRRMIDAATAVSEHSIVITNTSTIPDLKQKRILFAVELDQIGVNLSLLVFMNKLFEKGNDSLLGSIAGILIYSKNEMYTKSMARDLIFGFNQLGCSFPGHPLVEATYSYNNFLTWKKQYNLSLEEICLIHCSQLANRILTYSQPFVSLPRITALHSSSRKTSNTLMLWDLVKQHLPIQQIEELHVENGTVLDCIGCSYRTCMHFSQQNSCFYGGVMVKEVLPAIEKADILIWICPNYNDSVSANLMAVINRLTSLYRKIKLYDKSFFSIIVSGNSGSDSVAKQLIGALNVNKGLHLPPYFALMATANDPGAIHKIPNINKISQHFASNILP